jgi:hypothetical protein
MYHHIAGVEAVEERRRCLNVHYPIGVAIEGRTIPLW